MVRAEEGVNIVCEDKTDTVRVSTPDMGRMNELRQCFNDHLDRCKGSEGSVGVTLSEYFGMSCYAHDVGILVMKQWAKEWRKNNG